MKQLRTDIVSKWSSLLLLTWFACAIPAALGHGELHEQIEEVSEKIRAAPGDAALYLKRAELNRLHQEPAAAAADYDKAERLSPALPEVHLGRGKLLLEGGKLQEAREQLDRFLISSPNHLEALVTRARLEVKRNRPLVAAEDYARVLDLSVKPEPEHYLEYAKALAAAGPEQLPKALAILDRGIASLGQIPTLTLYSIELELARNNIDTALARLDRLSAGAKRKESWLERRGDILQQAGRSAEARAAYESALQALLTLPPQIRTKKATVELETRLRNKAANAPSPAR